MPSARSASRGFTLVEVLVALTIIGILIATTLPSYMDSRPARFLSQATNNLAANLNFARTQAIKNNAPVYVEFMPEIDSYRVWDDTAWKSYAKVVSGSSISACSVSPLRLVGPQLRYSVTATSIVYLERNYSTERAVATYAGMPDDVDLRMDPHLCAGQTGNNTQLMSRNGCISRDPLLYIQYFPDGRAANSWSTPCSVGGLARITSPNLGFTQLTLQVRGGYNTTGALNFHPNVGQVGSGDRNFGANPYPNPSLTPNQSLSYDAAISDDNGRRVLINNANGRITVEGFAPYLIDVPDGEDDEPNWQSPNNNKEWI